MPLYEPDHRPSWLDRRRVATSHDSDVETRVRSIIDDVRTGGDGALRRLTERFDGVSVERLLITKDEMEDACHVVDETVLLALRESVAAVHAFHSRQLEAETPVQPRAGVRSWRVWRPIERVGLYVPGGKARYPSSVVMLGVAAAVAGCRERVLVTPPGPDGRVPCVTLAAAAEVGITEVYSIGGAQAIAALAYGTESIRPVDKIFGPGNAFVTAAKLAVFPDVAIDMPAGPSELMIIADGSANPAWIAADLLGNAEHASDSNVVLVTPSRPLAEAVLCALPQQLQALPRKLYAEAALAQHGACLLVKSLDEAIDVANDYAPEHLQLMVESPHQVLERVSNAGSVFLGSFSPNAAGDYATGTNHVLPTGGHGRAVGALSVEAFGRAMQVQELTARGMEELAPVVARLARVEGLEGHARAAEIRVQEGHNVG